MRVDRSKAIRVKTPEGTLYFCSEHCAHTYQHGGHEAATPASTPARGGRRSPVLSFPPGVL